MSEQKFPVGIETFSEIREKGYVYVDKTEFIHRLVTNGKYYFLSRPRRFGKSLLLSTLEAFFEGRRELFRGLSIDSYDHDWKRHPVFHLNFVNADASSVEGLAASIDAHLVRWENEYGKDASETAFPQRFYGVIRRAAEKSGRQVVILVDEYDKPLFSAFDDDRLDKAFRNILKPLFGTLKAADRYISFAFLTGVTRFSRLSIFSDLNNLNDISTSSNYAAICGISQEELEKECSKGIAGLAESNGISYGQALSQLKENYDGYHFARKSPDLYNPYSVCVALQDHEIKDYWFATGTPTFLLTALHNRRENLDRLFNSEIDESSLAEVESYTSNPAALLFQTGYLTIKGYDPETGDLRLGIPNKEVERGLFRGLLPVFAGCDRGESDSLIRDITNDIKNGDVDSFLSRMKSFLADIPYHLSGNKPEVYFENNLYIIFKMLGLRVKTEYRTSRGRIDVLVTTGKFVYIMELKLDGSAEEALSQILSKEYELPFMNDGRKIFKIGINFSKKTRNIESWLID